MIVSEMVVEGDYKVTILLDESKGDRSRMFERNHNAKDVPLVICYNMGTDFPLRTDEEKRHRVLAMLKMIRVGLGEVMEDIGGLVGAHVPGKVSEGRKI